jgi:Transglycosylase-like domain
MKKFKRIASTVFLSSIVLLGAVACTPEQVSVFMTLTEDQQQKVIAARQTQTHTPPGGFLACVRNHESGGDYTAKNPASTASGAYQFLDSTWRTVSAAAGHGGYPTARSAPPAVQDAVAIHTLQTVGKSPWNGTGC